MTKLIHILCVISLLFQQLGEGNRTMPGYVTGILTGFLTDKLGSLRDAVDALGNPLAHVDYDPFGNLAPGLAPLASRYGWTGREYDAETGLYHSIKGRQYDPASGRWTGEDPTKFAGRDVNLYRYANNQPLDHTDPMGWRILGIYGDANHAFSLLRKIIVNLTTAALGSQAVAQIPERFSGHWTSVQVGWIYSGALGWTYSTKPLTQDFIALNSLGIGDLLGQVRRFVEKFYADAERDALLLLLDAVTRAGGGTDLFIKTHPKDANSLFYWQQIKENAEVPPSFLDKLGDANAFLEQISELANNTTQLWNLLNTIFANAQDKLPTLFDAIAKDPKGLFERMFAELTIGFNAFFGDYPQFLKAGIDWLFKGFSVENITLPALPTKIEEVAEFGVKLLLSLTNAEKIDFDYVKQVIADVTGFDPDSLLGYVDQIKELASLNTLVKAQDIGQALMNSLSNLGPALLEELTARIIQEFPKLVPGLVTTVMGKLIPGGPVLTTFLHTAQGLSANAQALEQLARKFFDTIELVINPNQNDPATNKPYVVGDMTRRLLAGALPVALDLAVRQVPTFVDIRVTFQTILKSMDLRQILQKAVQKIWTPIEKTLQNNPLVEKLIGRRLTPNFKIGSNSLQLWAVENPLTGAPEFRIGAAEEGTTPKGIPLLDQLAEWKQTYASKPKVVALIDGTGTTKGIIALVKDLQNPKKSEAKALMEVIGAMKERKAARATVKNNPKTRQNAATDLVKKADDKVVEAIGATKKDPNVQRLVRELNNLMSEIGPEGFGLFNIAPYGKQFRPSGNLQAHHVIQNQWAVGNNIPGYDRNAAPSILLERTNVRHSIITTRQNDRRDARVAQQQGIWSTSLEQEFKNARADLQAAGVPKSVIDRAIAAAHAYFESLPR